MADVQPLRALHYDPAIVGDIGAVVAPPYDVIDDGQRAALLGRSPFNVVAVDLPKPGADGRDAYETAQSVFAEWQREGAVVRDEEPALWAHTQDYAGPDGVARTRRGFFCRVRIEGYGPGRVRPHERTHPGPKEDRLRLTRATKANISPIFSLYSDPEQAAWSALEPATSEQPWADVTDGDGTRHRLWRVSDSAAIAAVRAATADAELLIADGHHRYETMDAYAEEVGGEGEHRFILMCLVALQDPGLTIFPTHRLVRGLDDARRAALEEALERDFEIEEVDRSELAPAPQGDVPTPLQMGYVSDRDGRFLRLTLKDQAIANAALAAHSAPYRRLDTGVLETLILKNALGMSDDDISHFNGMFYARDTDEAVAMVREGDYQAAFVMRPTPVGQVSELAAEGENMPPKSTFFYPKLLTGLLFNPLT
ncbi:MAG TPA: DUF1015 domain-containing protein [Solirubrobacteraceae bacterium]|nr:DUF1015 domain-containing protein [Solirubrobacteraceae bacterium]